MSIKEDTLDKLIGEKSLIGKFKANGSEDGNDVAAGRQDRADDPENWKTLRDNEPDR